MMKLLSTKTLEADIIATAQLLGFEITCIDFIEIKPKAFIVPVNRNFDAIVFTSSNAVKYFFLNEKAKAFCAGKKKFSTSGKTAEDLRVLGYLSSTADNAGDIAKLIGDLQLTSVLHVCGDKRLDELETKLTTVGIEYVALEVYETHVKNQKVDMSDADAVLFFSPSGVESFFSLNELPDKTVACCIGSTTAQALKEKNSDIKIITASQPSPDAMIEALALHFEKEKGI